MRRRSVCRHERGPSQIAQRRVAAADLRRRPAAIARRPVSLAPAHLKRKSGSVSRSCRVASPHRAEGNATIRSRTRGKSSVACRKFRSLAPCSLDRQCQAASAIRACRSWARSSIPCTVRMNAPVPARSSFGRGGGSRDGLQARNIIFPRVCTQGDAPATIVLRRMGFWNSVEARCNNQPLDLGCR